MFCVKCGHQINDDAKFCPECGSSQSLASETKEEARDAIRELFKYPEEKQESIFRDEAYTYYFIEEVQVDI